MAGPSNIFTPVFDSPDTDASLLWDATADNDMAPDVRVTNRTTETILYSLALAPTGTTPALVPPENYGVWDFEVEPGKPYDLEELLQVPEGWSLFHRASDIGLNVRVTGRKKEIA